MFESKNVSLGVKQVNLEFWKDLPKGRGNILTKINLL